MSSQILKGRLIIYIQLSHVNFLPIKQNNNVTNDFCLKIKIIIFIKNSFLFKRKFINYKSIELKTQIEKNTILINFS
jgi:hypothetical protein